MGDDAVHRVGEGGLAAARRAGDADEAAVGNGQVDFAVPREEIPGRVTEALAAMGIADVRDREWSG